MSPVESFGALISRPDIHILTLACYKCLTTSQDGQDLLISIFTLCLGRLVLDWNFSAPKISLVSLGTRRISRHNIFILFLCDWPQHTIWVLCRQEVNWLIFELTFLPVYIPAYPKTVSIPTAIACNSEIDFCYISDRLTVSIVLLDCLLLVCGARKSVFATFLTVLLSTTVFNAKQPIDLDATCTVERAVKNTFETTIHLFLLTLSVKSYLLSTAKGLTGQKSFGQ